MASRKGKPSRKANRKSRTGGGSATAKRALSIPELKAAFDALEQETVRILRQGTADAQLKEFKAAWQRIFHRPVSTAAAESYLAVKRTAPRRNTTRKGNKSQMGGAALAGAPLDYMTRPGLDGVYASVPKYLSSGLDFYNTINQTAMSKDCGVVDITPKVPITIGSNEVMKGGAPPATGNPPTPMNAAKLYWSGKPVGPSPDPSESTKLGI